MEHCNKVKRQVWLQRSLKPSNFVQPERMEFTGTPLCMCPTYNGSISFLLRCRCVSVLLRCDTGSLGSLSDVEAPRTGLTFKCRNAGAWFQASPRHMVICQDEAANLKTEDMILCPGEGYGAMVA